MQKPLTMYLIQPLGLQENGTGSFAKYISEDFNGYTHQYDLNYVSDPTSLPMETTFKAWLTDSTGKLMIISCLKTQFDHFHKV